MASGGLGGSAGGFGNSWGEEDGMDAVKVVMVGDAQLAEEFCMQLPLIGEVSRVGSQTQGLVSLFRTQSVFNDKQCHIDFHVLPNDPNGTVQWMKLSNVFNAAVGVVVVYNTSQADVEAIVRHVQDARYFAGRSVVCALGIKGWGYAEEGLSQLRNSLDEDVLLVESTTNRNDVNRTFHCIVGEILGSKMQAGGEDGYCNLI
mmetsp:Transcript_11630/g.17623  ORF Transcript_11630/g.17623 Transcript_11630/m.17623 type:complete len:202 (-) Transcript_11630:171-776(-)|eukprot:CAMPEP_0201514242 /NCGR_PEP_ID=MMETSP0161_2-20130828/6128_1 /ASSEMBLY_ACC=CAM_ASM_000251 /TAXON_ID=180227 /ORGANISM="Neoparamoeba aestuarina, Strain SoJaBio B1-5/56/2" /LENGTH=201 /DNA_ID=CAMNT_0047910739 /DNA_START=169 /DNA_END=774 /DNA_ORIENTATION=+